MHIVRHGGVSYSDTGEDFWGSPGIAAGETRESQTFSFRTARGPAYVNIEYRSGGHTFWSVNLITCVGS